MVTRCNLPSIQSTKSSGKLKIVLWMFLGGSLTLAIAMVTAPARVVATEGNPSGKISLQFRKQIPVTEGSDNFHVQTTDREWDPAKTALILCDVWDSHHCLNAVRRVQELAPRLDEFAKSLRDRGVTIIHAPSDCMAYYRDHPARKRTQGVKISPETPVAIAKWCDSIPGENRDPYPVDQSDGGEDDDLIEHEQWAERLKSSGRDPRRPWMRQIDTILIDADVDYISDDGKEIWNVLKQRGIETVLVCGVHTKIGRAHV